MNIDATISCRPEKGPFLRCLAAGLFLNVAKRTVRYVVDPLTFLSSPPSSWPSIPSHYVSQCCETNCEVDSLTLPSSPLLLFLIPYPILTMFFNNAKSTIRKTSSLHCYIPPLFKTTSLSSYSFLSSPPTLCKPVSSLFTPFSLLSPHLPLSKSVLISQKVPTTPTTIAFNPHPKDATTALPPLEILWEIPSFWMETLRLIKPFEDHNR